jgi:hypothetical protein
VETRQRAEGKEEDCKEEGYYGYFGGHDIISWTLLANVTKER